MITYIRFFCDTSGVGPVSELGWNFMRRMIRFRPVLALSLSGPQMGGRWIGYEALRATPQMGSYVNVVCTAPERWTWLAKVPAPDTPLSAMEIAAGDASTVQMITARQELWTAGVRNVLIAPAAPRSQPEIDTVCKYDLVIAPDESNFWRFSRIGIHARQIEHPYLEQHVRDAILGADSI